MWLFSVCLYSDFVYFGHLNNSFFIFTCTTWMKTTQQSASELSINCVLLCTWSFTGRHRRTFLTSSHWLRDYLVMQISNPHTRVTTTCRVLLLDLASDLLLLLALRLGTVCHRSWDVLLWTLPSGVVWRRSCYPELMAFLLTFSSGVLCRGLEGVVRLFGGAWVDDAALHLSSFTRVVFLTLSFL